MYKKISVLFIFASIIFSACKKDNDKPTQDTVIGKWKISKIEETDTIAGIPQINVYTGLATDYVDYRTDGKVYYNAFGGMDTFTYKILSNQLLVQDLTDTFQVATLTSSILIEKHHLSGSSYIYTEYLYR